MIKRIIMVVGLLAGGSVQSAVLSYDELLDGDLTSAQEFYLGQGSLQISGSSSVDGLYSDDIDQDGFSLLLAPGYRLEKAWLAVSGPVEIHEGAYWLPGGGDLLYWWGPGFAGQQAFQFALGAVPDGSGWPFEVAYQWQFETKAIPTSGFVLPVSEPASTGIGLAALALGWLQRKQRIGKAVRQLV